MTVSASARPDRPRRLHAALRAAVALMAVVTVLVVGLAGLFATAASARTLRRPETRVGAFGAAAGQVVGDHEPVLAGQRRARAPSYDRMAVGSCVAAETEPALADQAAAACGGMSFTASTPVLLADGSSMAISQLKVADQVLATNTATGKTQAETVTAVMVHKDTDLYDLTVQSGGVTSVVQTTSSHLFWDQTTHTWTQAAELHHGNKLGSPDQTTVTVIGGSTPPVTTGTMWDLTVTADHDFYIVTAASPVLVHNCPTEGASSFSSGRGPMTGDVTVFNGQGEITAQQSITSGGMTPEQAELGFPQSTLATHVEAQATSGIPLNEGDTMTIEGDRPPCPTCRGVMNQTAAKAGARIVYIWSGNVWIAGG